MRFCTLATQGVKQLKTPLRPQERASQGAISLAAANHQQAALAPIVSDDNPRGENADQIRKEILSECDLSKTFEIGNRREAIIYAIPGYIDYLRGRRFDQCYLQIGLHESVLEYLRVMLSRSSLPKDDQIIFWE